MSSGSKFDNVIFYKVKLSVLVARLIYLLIMLNGLRMRDPCRKRQGKKVRFSCLALIRNVCVELLSFRERDIQVFMR